MLQYGKGQIEQTLSCYTNFFFLLISYYGLYVIVTLYSNNLTCIHENLRNYHCQFDLQRIGIKNLIFQKCIGPKGPR